MTRLEYLFDKHLNKTCSAAEKEELFALIRDRENDDHLRSLIDEAIQQTGEEAALPAERSQEILSAVINAGKPARIVRFSRKRFVRRVAAAVLLLAAGSLITWGLLKRNVQPTGIAGRNAPQMDVAPGRNGALLTLADGRIVELDSLGNGLVATQQGRSVVLENGELSYKGDAEASVMAWNTMRTPRGRQFRLVLPDGSRVWLNAASSIRYPTTFSGSERLVEVSGEAYFEVAKMAAMPFRIKTGNDIQVEVLGTHFNINAYPDEASGGITLLEGSIKVSAASQSAVLRPGQQALAGEGTIKVNDHADIDQVMAWKNGEFNFNGMDLPAVLRQISRWYDVDIVYSGKVPDRKFGGEIQRDLTLSQVLRILERMHVNFKIEKDKKLIVM